MASKLLNYLLYQLGWFSCVLGAAWGYPFIGAFVTGLLVAAHLLLTDSAMREIRLMAFACLIGVTLDGTLQALGFFTLRAPSGWSFILPLWMLLIWVQFATLFRYSLYWLSRRYLLAAVFGMVGGPLAYGAGIRLGAAEMGDNLLLTVIVLSIAWAAVPPLLLWLSARWGGEEGYYRCFRPRRISGGNT